MQESAAAFLPLHEPEDASLDFQELRRLRFMASIRVQFLEVSPPHEPPQGFKAVQGLKFIFHERFESVGKLSLVLGFKARIVSGNSHPGPLPVEGRAGASSGFGQGNTHRHARCVLVFVKN